MIKVLPFPMFFSGRKCIIFSMNLYKTLQLIIVKDYIPITLGHLCKGKNVPIIKNLKHALNVPNILFLTCKPAFCFNCSHTATSGSRNSLAENMILHITGSINPFNICLCCACFGYDISIFIQIQLSL